MVLLENKLVRLEYDDSNKVIIWTPLAFMKDAEWQNPFVQGVEFLKKKILTTPNISWLNDTRKLKTVGLEDLNWLNKNVNEPCYKAGLKKVAFVLPTNVFGKIAVKFYVEYTNNRTDNQFQIKAFNNYNDSVNWLTLASGVTVAEEKL